MSYSIKSKMIRGVFGDKWLLRLERKAFGWHYWSLTTEDEQSLAIDDNGAHINHKYIKWLEFRRCSPYSANILFVLLELIDRIISCIRRICCPFVIPAAVVSIILALAVPEAKDTVLNIDMYIAIAYFGVLMGGTLAVSLLGFLTRKLFCIESRLSKKLIEAGYSGDVSDCRMSGE